MKVTLYEDLSPLKYCFIISPNDKKILLDSIKCMYTIWCGTYSNILPFYQRQSKKFNARYSFYGDRLDYYKGAISNLDPDIVVYDNALDEVIIKKISDGRQVVDFKRFKDGLESGRPDFGLSVELILDDILETEFKYTRVDNLKLSIPKIRNNKLFLGAWQGLILDKVYERYFRKNLLSKQFVSEKELSHYKFPEFFDDNTFSFRFLNIYKTGINNNINGYRKVLYFLDENKPLDIIDYWNLRALGWYILPIPYNRIMDKPYLNEIEHFVKRRHKKKGKGIVEILIAHEVDQTPILKTLTDIIKREKINAYLLDLPTFPRFWHFSDEIRTADLVQNPRVTFDYIQDSIEIDENDYLEFKLPGLPFKNNSYSRILFKIYMTFNYWNNEGKYAEVISDISTPNWITLIKDSGFGDEWRVSQQGIIKYVNHDQQNTYFYLPNSFSFFEKYFGEKGLSIKKTASGKLGKQVLKNIGGIHGTNIFSKQESISIIQLFEGGRVVSSEELIGQIKRGNPFPYLSNHAEIIELLLDKQIIEFGFKIQCSVCEQRSFYLPSDLENDLKCSICRNTFILPKSNPRKSLKYVYRGVGPFSRNNKVDGLLSVFLTIRLFNIGISDRINRGISFIFDFEINKGNNTFEIDLAVLTKSRRNKNIAQLFICECKTFKHIEQKDVDRLKFLGEKLPNSILVISTLNKSFTVEEKQLLTNLVESFRTKDFFSTNPILLLTSSELMPDIGYYGLKKYSDKIAVHSYVNYFHDLADLTCEKHLRIRTCSDLRLEAWQKVHQT